MKSPGPAISFHAHLVTLMLRVRPSFISRMRLIARDLAITSRADEGCIIFLAAESEREEGLFLITSAWRDEEAFEKHRASPYVRAFESQIEPELVRESVTYRSWKKIA
ncbi:MAG: hypothetical protein CVV32_11810 [Methanomicrobiales archaeon HGW-Methanomicrobiales-3]|jgi:quinol monooxygenase YgiN|nr:MAG: hypothetical protein CVV32_11810 [Methanomicrobiales archaeon HGW-Methanomicrobiales-3]